MKLLLIALLVVLLPFGSEAHAAFISIVPSVEAEPDEAAGELAVKAVIRNEGDEAAREVRIELPEADRSFTIAAELKPGASAEWSVRIPFAELKTEGVGQFAAPYRIHYRDLNYYPFSAAYLLLFNRGEAPGRGTVASFDGEPAAPVVELGKRTSVDVELKSIAPTPLRIDAVELITSAEVGAEVTGKTGVELKKGETAEFSVKLENSGALIGSSYAAQLVVRGERNGKRFADITGFQVGIVDSRISPVTFLSAVLAVSAAFVFWYAFRRRPKDSTS